MYGGGGVFFMFKSLVGVEDYVVVEYLMMVYCGDLVILCNL